MTSSADRTFSVFADYNQFFLLDEDTQPSYPEEMSDLAISQRFLATKGLIAIYTAKASNVSVSVKVLDAAPPNEFDGWSHVVRCSIESKSGNLILAGCTDYLPDCPRIQIPSGVSAMLICGKGFAQEEHEAYSLLFWPGDVRMNAVLKQYDARNG